LSASASAISDRILRCFACVGRAERRDSKQLDVRLRRASFDGPRAIEDFHFNPKIPKSKIIDLATCGFVQRKENVLLVGRAGVGKSHIAGTRATRVSRRLRRDLRERARHAHAAAIRAR
jgi:DNA replication protein DnaC